MTPGVEFTRGRVAAGRPGDGAVDLGEIRRSDEIIGVLAARAATPRPLLRDPAVAALCALTADVDGWDGAPQAPPGMLHGLRRRGRGGADVLRVAAPPRGMASWVRAAVAGVVVAGIAGTTSVVTAGMLARLARGPAGGFGRSARDLGATVRLRRSADPVRPRRASLSGSHPPWRVS
jgi:hypothetical protein